MTAKPGPPTSRALVAAAFRDLKRDLEALPSYRNWEPRFRLTYIRNLLKKLPDYMSRRAWKTFSVGPDLPVDTLENRGISAENFENPEKLAFQLLENPEEAMQMEKLFRKMIITGGASCPLPNGTSTKIFGKNSISMPGFIVYTKGKARYVNNLSKRPYFREQYVPRSVRTFTLNKGYTHEQTTMGFHGIEDKAASALALPVSSRVINVDLKGYFFQIPQNPDMIHYQIKTFPVPRTDDPNGPWTTCSFALMGTEMGNAIAAAAAGGAHIAIVRAMDLKAQSLSFPDLLSIPRSKVVPPSHYGLSPVKASFRKILERFPTKYTNQDPWIHLDHTHLALWRSRSERFPCYSIHQDDVALKNVNRQLTAQAGEFLYQEYSNCNILTSTTFSEDDVLEEDIITGTPVNFRTKLLGLPPGKWEK